MTSNTPPISVEKSRLVPTRWDLLALLLVFELIVFLADTSRALMQPLAELQAAPISLDPAYLPGYAARTTLRMLAAMALSLLFTFTYATFAAKSRRAELVLIPVLDILQSVPILGFISITIVFFMSLAPGKVLGAEFGDLRHIHEPGVEHGIQLLSIAAHDPGRPCRSVALLSLSAVDAVLACRGALRHARIGLEHDDVDVRRMVLRRSVGSDQRWRYDYNPAGNRVLHRGGHRTARHGGDHLGDRDDAPRHPHLRPVAIPAPGCLGRPVSLRAGSRRHAAAVLGPHRADTVAIGRTDRNAVGGSVAVVLSPTAANDQIERQAAQQSRGSTSG